MIEPPETSVDYTGMSTDLMRVHTQKNNARFFRLEATNKPVVEKCVAKHLSMLSPHSEKNRVVKRRIPKRDATLAVRPLNKTRAVKTSDRSSSVMTERRPIDKSRALGNDRSSLLIL